MNSLLSLLSMYIILAQPVTLICMIPNSNLRYILLFCIFSFYIINKVLNTGSKYYTSVGKNGHLYWSWTKYNGYANINTFIFLLFYILPLFIIGNNIVSFFIITMLIISLINHFKYNTFGTMWCWSSNIIFLYFLVTILLLKPFYEYNSLC